MTLLHPIWIVLLVPLAACWLMCRLPTRLLRVVRALIFILIVLALCRPAIQLPDRAGTVVVVADRSESMPVDSQTKQKEAIELMRKGMGPRDKLAVVSFGYDAALEQPPQSGEFSGFITEVGKEASRMDEGLKLAMSIIPRTRAGRVFVMSDGKWTGGDPSSLVPGAVSREISIDYRVMQRSSVGDTSIFQIQAPETVMPGESFLVTSWVRSPVEQSLTYEFKRGTKVIARGKKQVTPGLTRLMFRDRAEESGTGSYLLTVAGEGDDPIPENNRGRILVGVEGERSMLCLANKADSALATALESSGIKITRKTAATARWSLEELSNYSALLIENVSANDIGPAGLDNIATWVEQAGTGLMMTGGKRSYGTGGYFGSTLERIMPVSMELRKEHRKLQLAIVVVLDRSGSMAAPAGSGGQTKMDLANIGTAQVLDLLSDMDELGVIAVDSTPHTIVNLRSVSANRSNREKILQIESMGGGIFVYEGLSAAVRMLLKSNSETRHVILFSDAADSEQPGKYKELIRKCRAANITISVIGLGTRSDCDARLLEDIAKRGDGQCFFTTSPEEIPRLFAQDTFTVARSTFVEELTPVKMTAGYFGMTGRNLPACPAVGGYNLCYVRPGATPGAVTVDDYKAPIVGYWRAAMGRVVCFTAEADGKFAGDFARWDKAATFYSSLARWTVGAERTLPDGMLLTQEVRDGICVIQLHLDPDRRRAFFDHMPTVRALRGNPGEKPVTEELEFGWMTPDTLQVEVQIKGSETVLPVVAIQNAEEVILSPVCLPYSPEYAPTQPGKGTEVMAKIAEATGGEERIDLQGIWGKLSRTRQPIEVAHWLALAALIFLLIEVLERRTGVLSGLKRPVVSAPVKDVPQGKPMKRRRRKRQGGKGQGGKSGSDDSDDKPEPPEPSAEPEQEDGFTSTIDAMRKLRNQNRRRGM